MFKLVSVGSRRAFSLTAQCQGLKSVMEKTHAAKKIDVQPLMRPIGMETKPDSKETYGIAEMRNRTLKQRKDDLLSIEKNKQRQEALEQEFATSGLHDVYAFRHTQGKFFLSPSAYFRADKAKYFPNFIGKLLTGKPGNVADMLDGKVSLVRVYTSSLGQEQVDGFFLRTEEDQADGKPKSWLEGNDLIEKYHGNVQVVDVHMEENAIKGLIVSLFKSRIRSSVSPWRHDKYLFVRRKDVAEEVKRAIKLDNLYTGYVYVVDRNGKIRWAACGETGDEERAMLWKTVQGVLREPSRPSSLPKGTEKSSE